MKKRGDTSTASNTTKMFYNGLREVYAPPLPPPHTHTEIQAQRGIYKDILTKNESIHKRWSEHFEQLLHMSSSVESSAIDNIATLPFCLELDDLPTQEEVVKVISELQCGKSAGPDGIPPDVFKMGGTSLK